MSEKDKKLHLGHFLGLGVCIALGTYKCFQSSAELDGSIFHIVKFFAFSAITILGLFDVFRNWQSDLVECRRFLRLSAQRAHTNAPYKTDSHRKILRALNRPGRPGPCSGRGSRS